jgi:hypothetical protein
VIIEQEDDPYKVFLLHVVYPIVFGVVGGFLVLTALTFIIYRVRRYIITKGVPLDKDITIFGSNSYRKYTIELNVDRNIRTKIANAFADMPEYTYQKKVPQKRADDDFDNIAII